jgi:hypothetical protein
VTTNVVIRSDHACLIPKHDDAFGAYLLQDVISEVRDPVLTSHAQPALGEDFLTFFGEDLGRDVIAARQRAGAIDGDLGGLEELCHRCPRIA